MPKETPAAKTALDRHRTLRSSNDNEDEANQDSEPEISNLRVNDTETQHQLLCFTGKLAGKNAVFLVDSGSTHDFIAQNFVERHNLEGTCSEEKLSMTLADGSTVSQQLRRTKRLKMVLGEFGETQTFTVFSLGKYDAILGKPWLTRNNPSVDFCSNEMVKRAGTKLLPREEASSIQESDREEPSGVEINFISGKQARHELRRGEQGFLAWISDADKETGGRVDMKELIDSDSDVSSGQRTKLLTF